MLIPHKRGTKLPATPSGVRLAVVVQGHLYSLRPKKLVWSPCPYCGRENPTCSDGRVSGFRKVGFNKHVFGCFERALAAAGYREGPYDDVTMKFPLQHLPTP